MSQVRKNSVVAQEKIEKAFPALSSRVDAAEEFNRLALLDREAQRQVVDGQYALIRELQSRVAALEGRPPSHPWYHGRRLERWRESLTGGAPGEHN